MFGGNARAHPSGALINKHYTWLKKPARDKHSSFYKTTRIKSFIAFAPVVLTPWSSSPGHRTSPRRGQTSPETSSWSGRTSPWSPPTCLRLWSNRTEKIKMCLEAHLHFRFHVAFLRDKNNLLSRQFKYGKEHVPLSRVGKV